MLKIAIKPCWKNLRTNLYMKVMLLKNCQTILKCLNLVLGRLFKSFFYGFNCYVFDYTADSHATHIAVIALVRKFHLAYLRQVC